MPLRTPAVHLCAHSVPFITWCQVACCTPLRAFSVSQHVKVEFIIVIVETCRALRGTGWDLGLGLALNLN